MVTTKSWRAYVGPMILKGRRRDPAWQHLPDLSLVRQFLRMHRPSVVINFGPNDARHCQVEVPDLAGQTRSASYVTVFNHVRATSHVTVTVAILLSSHDHSIIQPA